MRINRKVSKLGTKGINECVLEKVAYDYVISAEKHWEPQLQTERIKGREGRVKITEK